MLRLRIALLCVLALTSFSVAGGQTHGAYDPHSVDGHLVGGALDINTAWLAKPADDPAFASPQYDDRAWKVVSPSKPLNEFGIQHVDHLWYRTHVHIPSGMKNLGILVEGFCGSYRVYVNGREIGGTGRMDRGGALIFGVSDVYSIPDDVVQAGDLTIAIHAVAGRVDTYDNGQYQALSQFSKVQLGSTGALEQTRSLTFKEGLVEQACIITLTAVVLLLAVGLALLIRHDPVYPAVAVMAATLLVEFLLALYMKGHDSDLHSIASQADELFKVINIIALVEFTRLVAGVRRAPWIVVAECMQILPPIARWLETYPHFPFVAGFLTEIICQCGIEFVVVALLAVGVVRRRPESGILALPLAAFSLVEMYVALPSILLMLHLPWHVPDLPPIHVGNWSTTYLLLLMYLFISTVLVLLVLRTMRIVRERAVAAREIEAAQTMQQMLLSRASEPTPGFEVESVYHPASEVGGDFFLVSPGGDGSLVAIVGDVSGKGLVAAMRVSMILGVLRRESSRRPGEVLNALNEALLAQSDAGFTTACCVRLERDGRFIVANAGHIAPYVGGGEVETSPSLPLGLAPDQEYVETEGTLAGGEKMVLMSDGVVEARAKDGELYGFERLKGLTSSAAQQIAEAAKTFGQEDDITVLTIACGA